jgi:imidazolonepropionase-like amidohydrolase
MTTQNALPEPSAIVASRRRLVFADRILTSPEADILHRGVVIVEGGRISAVGPATDYPAKPGDIVTELGDVVLAHGIIDTHVHLGFDGSNEPSHTMETGTDDDLRLLIRGTAKRLLAAGVTTVRDLGCRGTHVSELAEQIEAGSQTGPTLIAANQPLTETHGHCSYMCTPCDSADELLAGVAERIAEGATAIKIMQSGGFMHPEGDAPYRPVFDAAAIRGAVQVAHSHGLRVAAHAHGVAAIEQAVLGGVDSIEHCSMATPDGVAYDLRLARMMAVRNTAAIPTVSHVWNVPLPWGSREASIALVAGLHAEGVPIALGTDCGIPDVLPGDQVSGLAILAECGLSPAETWAAATTGAATVIGRAGVTGAIEAGTDCQLVAWRGDPREIGALVDPVWILTAAADGSPADILRDKAPLRGRVVARELQSGA